MADVHRCVFYMDPPYPSPGIGALIILSNIHPYRYFGAENRLSLSILHEILNRHVPVLTCFISILHTGRALGRRGGAAAVGRLVHGIADRQSVGHIVPSCWQCLCIDDMHSKRIDSHHFYPRDAMLARVIAIATCLPVCLSVRLSVCLSVRHAPVLCQNEES